MHQRPDAVLDRLMKTFDDRICLGVFRGDWNVADTIHGEYVLEFGADKFRAQIVHAAQRARVPC